jgi:hypothetical protein
VGVVGLLLFPVALGAEWMLSELGVNQPRAVRPAFEQARWMAAGRLVLRGRSTSPRIDVRLTETDTATAFFFADKHSIKLHFLLKSPALTRAPWLCLEGTDTFFLMPAPLLLARSLPRWDGSRWRYWGSAVQRSLLENASLREALATLNASSVLLSRPGRVRVVLDVLAGREGVDAEWVDRTLERLEKVARRWAELVGPGLSQPLRNHQRDRDA